jgi:choline dehydrogenase
MASFDYVIVGAGSAGCVLAERLSADPRNRVLLIEEGARSDDWLARMPKGFARQLADPARTHFIPTLHDPGDGGQPETWVRGKQLGGSSAVNGAVWTRGQPEDYDRLAELAGPAWGWREMLPCLKALEDHGLGSSDMRGVGGPIPIGTHPAPTPLTEAFLEAGNRLGLPVKIDQNQLEQEGVGYLQWNIDRRGRRVSAARGFLAPAMRRPNLAIERGVRIDRVVVADGRAAGVSGVRGRHGVEYRCDGEIILCAGAIGSPRILQLSGIGPGAILKAAGVPVVLEHPDVGQHLREHWLLMQNFRLRSAKHCQNRSFSGLGLLANLARYAFLGTGPLAYGSSEAGAFVRVLPESTRPDTQLMFAPYSLAAGVRMTFESEPGFQIFSYRLRPMSEGSVAIAGSEPGAPLQIHPNHLSHEEDRRTLVAAVRFVRKLVAQPPLAAMVSGEGADTAGAESDDAILELLARRGQSGFHATGTVRMGICEGPLDGRLRLRGVQGLRVADMSVFPEMIAGNTNAPTMAMALRASRLILEDRP